MYVLYVCIVLTSCVHVAQERLDQLDQELAEEEERRVEEGRIKKERIDEAALRRDKPVNESEIVDEMFGFMDPSSDTYETPSGPSAFQVLHIYSTLEVFTGS